MKYIRTWYGKLFGVAGLSKTGKSVFYISKKSGKQCQMPRNSRDRIADTIEELCDCFAVEETFNSKIFGPSFFCGKLLASFYAEKKREVVGYIIIEKKGVKALEPVAKTNEKGEFELI